MDEEHGEGISISGDPEDGLRALMGAASTERRALATDAKLDWIKKASAEELDDPELRDRLIQEAREAGATPEQIDEALDEHR
jgi:hypothetical protein